MTDPLDRHVTEERLRQLLNVRGEGDSWDFKLIFDLSKNAAQELTKDILSFANSGGGHLVFGVHPKTYEPCGISNGSDVDVTKIHNAIAKYVAPQIKLAAAAYKISAPAWENERWFGILYVAAYSGIAMPATTVNTTNESGQQKLVFKPSDIFVRDGGQSTHAKQDPMNQLLQRILGNTSKSTVEATQPPIVDNLPPRERIAFEFVGRTHELLQLWSWFNDPYRCRWLLAGDGGKGKSAIAYEFATQVAVANPNKIANIVWLSAKRREYIDGTTRESRAPDFWDLDSLFNAYLTGTGFSNDIQFDINEKRMRVLKMLKNAPALLIADDIDSLAEESEDAVEFLTVDAPGTHSKVLLTSRRIPYGLYTSSTKISGLSGEDGRQFIISRISLHELDQNQFPDRIMTQVLDATDASPLYIEDLIRLCTVLPVEDAIREWQGRGGDEARKYALQREFEMLSHTARDIVLACCANGGPISLPEMQAATNLSKDKITSELSKIQSLFLIGKPRLIDDVPRFDTNSNTRLLVIGLYENSDSLRRIRGALQSIRNSEHGTSNRGDIASYIRQAISLERTSNHQTAERTILVALERHPGNADLTAQLGMLYSRWKPRPRLQDAREHFGRALQLKCRRENFFTSWCEMELKEKEWGAAADVAHKGIRLLRTTGAGNSRSKTSESNPWLLFIEGYAHSRRGQELKRALHPEKAQGEMEEADRLLQESLRLVPTSGPRDRELQQKVLRALVTNSRALGKTHESRQFEARLRSAFPSDEDPR
ncbi:MAG TPA: ATP-binding protein [Candidatus Nanopelagicales bacterium]|nr:ATP-binding protein [Candidatus Nanopelagicales bacterium]